MAEFQPEKPPDIPEIPDLSRKNLPRKWNIQ
jgi:hypothetical protein